MGHHESFVRKEWEKLLARKDLVGGNLYFVEAGHEYVGRISKIHDSGDRVLFYFEWCACKTEFGWTRRKRIYATRMKTRIKDSPDPNVIEFDGDRLFAKGHDKFEYKDTVAPTTPYERRVARAKARGTPLLDLMDQ